MATQRNRRKPNIKPKHGVGPVISRQRRKITTEIDRKRAVRQEAERSRAQADIERAKQSSHSDSLAREHKRNVEHALRALSSNHRAFLASINRSDIPVRLRCSSLKFVAYTDFSSIEVNVPIPDISKSLRELVIEVRGILHHETGHLRFTKPLNLLWESVKNDVTHEFFTTDDEAYRYGQLRRLTKIWNTLEDQRMERAVVKHTPRIAKYFIPMVLNVVLANNSDSTRIRPIGIEDYLLVGGRTYMPKSVVDTARQNFINATDVDTLYEWDSILNRYCSATTDMELFLAVIDAYTLLAKVVEEKRGGYPGGTDEKIGDVLDRVLIDGDDHKPMSNNDPVLPNDDRLEEAASEPSDDDEASGEPSDDDEDESSNDSTSSADGDDESGDTSGDDESSENDNSAGRRRAISTDESTTSSFELEDELEKAMQDIANSTEVESIMSSIASNIANSTLLEVDTSDLSPLPDEHAQFSRSIEAEVREALSEFVFGNSPLWQHRQEEGYIDALAYRTREIGQRDYRRHMVNLSNRGIGIHLSFLADVSASMRSIIHHLSATTLAFRNACDSLDIPSTIVLWSSDRETERLWDTESPSPVTFPTGGNTDPRLALDDLDHHRSNPELHQVVVIFTDGEWARHSVSSVDRWRQDNRTFIVIGLNCGKYTSTLGADVVVDITDINELGSVMRSEIVRQVQVRS
jgi:hypothetical protein